MKTEAPNSAIQLSARQRAALSLFTNLAVGLLATGLSAFSAFAASDNADNPPYADGWNDNTNPPADNGGSGFQPWINLENTGGSKYIANVSNGGRQVDGNDSFGIMAASGTGENGYAEGRPLVTPITAGIYTVTARFDLANTQGFSGFNLKTAAGTQFGTDAFELLAFGMFPTLSNPNNTIGAFGAATSTIDLGHDIRGDIIQFSLSFDTSGTTSYTLTATDVTNFATGSTSGQLKFAGSPVDVLGFGNFNSGTNQDLIFDSIAIEAVPEPATWLAAELAIAAVGYLQWQRLARLVRRHA